MAITSVGYSGTVNEAQWAELATYAAGATYSVAGANDWAPSLGSTDRSVKIGPGKGTGWGVLDTNSADVTVTLGTISSGSRWDLVVARRNWSTNSTSFVVVAGSGTKALPTRNLTPGTLDDQPVALARVQAGSSAVVEIVDLRTWVADGGAYAKDDLVLSFLNRLGTQLRINDTLWFRALDITSNPVWRTTPVAEDTGWLELPALNGGWFVSGSPTPKYRIKGGLLHLSGRLYATANATDNPFSGVLPAGARPDLDVAALVGEVGGSGLSKVVYVATSGVVTVFKGGSAGTAVNDLSLSSFPPVPVT